jgi:hypothetical protein
MLDQKYYDKLMQRTSVGDDNECWLSLTVYKGKNRDAIGITHNGLSQVMNSSKLAYLLHHGLEPDDIQGQLVCHSCDNKRCNNPNHLYLGDSKTNREDAIRDGQLSGYSELTIRDEKEIRELYELGDTQRGLAEIFGVSQTTIWRVVHRKNTRSKRDS